MKLIPDLQIDLSEPIVICFVISGGYTTNCITCPPAIHVTVNLENVDESVAQRNFKSFNLSPEEMIKIVKWCIL